MPLLESQEDRPPQKLRQWAPSVEEQRKQCRDGDLREILETLLRIEKRLNEWI